LCISVSFSLLPGVVPHGASLSLNWWGMDKKWGSRTAGQARYWAARPGEILLDLSHMLGHPRPQGAQIRQEGKEEGFPLLNCGR
jgi:hypothetical protein